MMAATPNRAARMPKRPLCPHCERPMTTCLCKALVSVDCPYRLVILQDPREARHALSSAPILIKQIRSASLWVGDVFDPAEVIGANWQTDAALVFPSTQATGAHAVKDGGLTTLVFLDGTWKKAARLIHLNPWLQELPCLALQPDQPSTYRIRKSPRADGLSTIEAAVQVLNGLQSIQDFSVILPAFEKMIDYQITAMGRDTYRKNHLKT